MVHDPQDDLDLALEMADRADAMTLADFTGSELVFADKADGTPVTETDRLVEEVLRAFLAERRPRDGFLGEETGASGSARRQWSCCGTPSSTASRRARSRNRRWTEAAAISCNGVTPCPLCKGELHPEPETITLVGPFPPDSRPSGQLVTCRRCGAEFVATGLHRSRPVLPSRN